MANRVVHFEINVPDLDRDVAFFAELFGWRIQPMPEMGYAVVDTGAGKGINGGLGQSESKASVVVYIEVPNVKETLETLEQAGAKTVMPETVIPNVVTFGQFADPQGNVIGLVEAGEGPGVSPGDNPAVDYFEIVGPDAPGLWTFYREQFGWEIEQQGPGGNSVYGHVHAGESAAEGGIGSHEHGHVTVYARVGEVARYLSRAESIGAKTITPPTDVSPGLTIGHFATPGGAIVGLYSVSE